MNLRGTRTFIKTLLRFGLVMNFVVSLSGCGLSFLAKRDTNPVIQDYAIPSPPLTSQRATNIFATTASRRLVIITTDREDKNRDSFMTCAEPSPDVGESFADSVAAGIKAAASVNLPEGAGTSVSGDLAAQYGRAVATQIAPLLYRTQGLQLYRDSTYKLCIDRMNGWITDNDKYESLRTVMFNGSVELIAKELEYMKEMLPAFYANMKPGEAKESMENLNKILEALKLLETQKNKDDQGAAKPAAKPK